MKKYFEPDIEDLRTGYECELLQSLHGEYDTEVSKPSYYPYKLGRSVVGKILTGDLFADIRVPYLTKEQIEAEGWNYKELDWRLKQGIFFFEKDNYMMTFDSIKYYINILARDVTKVEWLEDYPELFRVTIPCKDINTFRYICKLLKINE